MMTLLFYLDQYDSLGATLLHECLAPDTPFRFVDVPFRICLLIHFRFLIEIIRICLLAHLKMFYFKNVFQQTMVSMVKMLLVLFNLD